MQKLQRLYNLENFDTIANSLIKIERKEDSLTANEVVERLLEPIAHALSMRYSFNEIAETIFNANGCNISANALKTSYEELTNIKKPRKKRTAKITPINENNNE